MTATVDSYQLSFAQQRLWFADQLAPGSAAYNMYEAYRLRGPLDIAALRAALADTVTRHEALRTTFGSSRGVPHQVIGDAAVDLDTVADVRAELGRPFRLDRDPPLRVALERRGADDHVLLAVLHHIVADEQSMAVFWRDLGEFYRCRVEAAEPALPALPVRYVDYAAWQRGWLSGAVLADELDHWRRALSGAPLVLDLPTDQPRPARQTDRHGTVEFALPPDTLDAVRRTARAAGATPFMVLLAAFAVVLAKRSGRTDLVIGTFAGNRSVVEVEDLVGLFVNTLPLRVQVGDDPTFAELLRTVKTAALTGIRQQEVPFDQVVTALRPPRDLSRNPVAQVACQELPPLTDRLRLPGVEVAPYAVGQCGDPFDLRLAIRDQAGELHYAADLFQPATAGALASWYVRLLTEATTEPGHRLSQLPDA